MKISPHLTVETKAFVALQRKRRLDDIGFPIDAGGFSGACGNIVCNKDCNICCKALRQFWREVCG